MINQKSKLWYLLQFKPNSHRVAEVNLNRQGFKTFIPVQEVSKRRFSRFVSSIVPLFPGYMFVSFNPKESSWLKIRATIGVLGLVGVGGKLKEIPTDIIEEIMQRCDQSGKLLQSKPLVKGCSSIDLKFKFKLSSTLLFNILLKRLLLS